MSNSEVKPILQKIVNATRKALKLDEARWAYKTHIGTSPYRMVFGKAFHLPIELEQQAYWAIEKLNLDPEFIGHK